MSFIVCTPPPTRDSDDEVGSKCEGTLCVAY